MVAPLNQVTIATPRNGTTTHTVTPSSGTVVAGSLFTPTAGRLLVCIAEGSVTSTTPTGWTLPTGGSAVNLSALYVWWRVAAGSDSFTTTHNASNYPVAFTFLEFPAGSTFSGSAAATGVVWSGAAGPTLSGLTGTNQVFGVAGQGFSVTTGTNDYTWTPGFTFTELVDTYTVKATTDGYTYSICSVQDFTGASAAFNSASAFSGKSQERLMFAVKAAAAGGPPPNRGQFLAFL